MTARADSDLYVPLLGVRFARGGRDPRSGLDCIGVVRAYLERLHGALPPDAFPLDETAPGAWAESSGRWEPLGADLSRVTRRGDVVLSSSEHGPHVAALVYDRAPRLLLSASLARGTYTIPLARMSPLGSLVGCYRLRLSSP